MAFKFVIFAAVLAYANAGYLGGAIAPVAYSPAAAVSSAYIHRASPVVAPVAVAHAAPVAVAHAAPVAIQAPSIGSSQLSVVRSLGGNQAVSHYTKAVDSAFSSVRKFDTRITNDALIHAPVAVAHAAPVVSTYAAHAAPVVSTYAAHAAPVVSTYAAHPAPVVSTYAAHPAPVVSTYAAPAAPLLSTYAAHAPVVAKTAAVAYSPAAVVSHASFSGLGVSYGW